MSDNKVDSLLIVDNKNKLLGIVTSKDARRNMNSSSIKLESIMSKDVIYANDEDSISDVLRTMNEHNVSFVPIVNKENILKGLITKSSLITIFEEKLFD